MYLDNKVGKYLREKREGANLTQVKVANQLGYASSQFISNIERGISGPPPAIIKKLSELYGSSKRELLKLLINEREQFLKKALYGK